MANITQWSEGECELFSHKLEEIIHGPVFDPLAPKLGFIMIAFPLTDESAAKMFSNCDGQTVVTVMYKVLQGLVDRETRQ